MAAKRKGPGLMDNHRREQIGPKRPMVPLPPTKSDKPQVADPWFRKAAKKKGK